MSESVADRMSKTGAATHTQCRLWVIRYRPIQRQRRPMTAVTPIDGVIGRPNRGHAANDAKCHIRIDTQRTRCFQLSPYWIFVGAGEFLIPTAPNIDSLRDSQIRESLT